jgi:hypothetical protein
MSRADEFRKNADAAREFARTTMSPDDRAIWLEIAGHWDQLAREATRHPDAFPPGDGTS